MSVNVATLLAGVIAQQTVASVQNQDGSGGGPNVPFSPQDPAGSNSPSTYQGFQLVVTGSGNVSATAQIVASNDGVNWTNLTTATASSAAAPNSALANNAVPYKYYGAYISAISGTNASATLTMCS